MKKGIFLLIITLLFSSCEESTLLDNTGILKIETQNLPSLQSSYVYKIWLVGTEANVLAGKFTINSDGTQSTNYFSNIDKTDLYQASGIVITIDKSSSVGMKQPYILVGTFTGNTITLSSNSDSSSFFFNASAQCQIRTPSDNVSTNELHGIWYANTSEESLLNFPTNNQFHFQSWLKLRDSQNQEKYLNMGKFTTLGEADNSQRYSETFTIPNYAGEDFLKNPDGISLTPPFLLENATVILEVIPGTISDNTNTQPVGFTIAKKTITNDLISANNIITMEIPTFTATGNR